jgi:two-component system, OmpR family, sensor kinase
MTGPTLHPIEPDIQESSRMLSLVVHELRSPAAVVHGYLRLLLKRTSNLAVADRKLLEDAASGCARLTRVLQELDELADLEAGDPLRTRVPLPIFGVCAEVVEAAAVEGGSIVFRCDDPDCRTRVLGEAERLRRALGALASVGLREFRGRAMEVYGFVSPEEGGPRAIIAFAEPGLFERRPELAARRTEFDRWRGGTGLALPIASRIIEAHGGQLWSVPGASPSAYAVALPLVGT